MFQVGENIRMVRRFTNLSQKGFAEAFGITGRNGKPSEDILSTYERDITYPPVELLQLIARSAGMEFKRFISERISLDDIEEVAIPNELSVESEISSFNEQEATYDTKYFKEKYYKQLEDHNKLLTEQLRQSQELIRKVSSDLVDVLKNQLTIVSMSQAAVDVILKKLTPSEQEHQALLKSVDRLFALKRSEYEKKGNLIEVRI